MICRAKSTLRGYLRAKAPAIRRALGGLRENNSHEVATKSPFLVIYRHSAETARIGTKIQIAADEVTTHSFDSALQRRSIDDAYTLERAPYLWGMLDAHSLIESLRLLPADEIRRRLSDLIAEEKALRKLLRLRIDAEPKRSKTEAASHA